MYVDSRTTFIAKHIKNKDARILELGPLNRPTVTKDIYPNCRYCDIRATDEVKKLYSGNTYLEATGIWVDTETIIDIDDVIDGTYTNAYAGTDKFDVVIASHVMEHMHDLIFALLDMSGILIPNGIFCIVYPDKRYSFDHFRQSASFRDAYATYKYGKEQNARMVLDFAFSSIDENSPFRFWNGENMEQLLPLNDPEKAIEQYEQALNGIMPEDVHYWPFTDHDFLVFLYDSIRAGILPFTCIDFVPTSENEQQFMVALRYTPDVLEAPKKALRDLSIWISKAQPSFYCSKDIALNTLSQQQAQELQRIKESNLQCTAKVIELQQDIIELHQNLIEVQNKNIQLKAEIEGVLAEKQSQLEALLAEKQAQHAFLNELLINTQNRLSNTQTLLFDMQAQFVEKEASYQTQLTEKVAEYQIILAEKEIEYQALLAEKEIEYQALLAEKEIEYQALLAEKEKQYADQAEVLHDKERYLLELSDLLERAKIHANNLEYYLKSYEQSTSWRITSPLRAISRLFKK